MKCLAEIKLCASLDGQHLVVKSVNSNHNYDVSKVNVHVTLYIPAINIFNTF